VLIILILKCNKDNKMTSLSVIREEFEDEVPEECVRLINRLSTELESAICRIKEYEQQLSKFESADLKIKELMILCQSKNAEIFALERKVKELTTVAEEKDKQIISMLSMATEFKQLVQNQDKAVQVDMENGWESERKYGKEEGRLKELSNNQHFEGIDRSRVENSGGESYLGQGRKKVEGKNKGGGYMPLFLRKPKEGYLSNM
jgi:predicted  nucleic acid-binding Zn-ribbon protein